MTTPTVEQRLRNAWVGRISGCMLGKPVEVLSMVLGQAELDSYLDRADAIPLRDYIPMLPGTLAERHADCCKDGLVAAVPDDDINYTVLSLMMLETWGTDFTTDDVARAWMRWLPGGMTFTAERAAYATLLANASIDFASGAPAGFDLAMCSDNKYNDWIGAQIRTDMYGWIAPGEPESAADMAGRDARPEFPVGPFYVKECSLHGFVMFKATAVEMHAAAEDINHWFVQGKLKANISATLPLDQAAEAHRMQEAATLQGSGGLSGKIVITFD